MCGFKTPLGKTPELFNVLDVVEVDEIGVDDGEADELLFA